jgi:hypothetical protein
MHTRTLKAEDEVKVRQLKADPKWTRFVDPEYGGLVQVDAWAASIPRTR